MASDGKLTGMILRTKSGEFDIDSIHSLVLSDMGLSELGCICECNRLERLDLSRNRLSKLYGLAGLSALTTLNLSANRITSLEGLQALENLHTLNLAGNNINSLEGLRWLSGIDKLRVLRLKDKVKDLSNPICDSPRYKTDIQSMAPNLTVLDGERLHGRGSDVFRLCDQIDQTLKAEKSEPTREVDLMDKSGRWFPEGLWDINSKQLNKINTDDSEEQLNILLDSCRHVKQKAEEQFDTWYCQNQS